MEMVCATMYSFQRPMAGGGEKWNYQLNNGLGFETPVETASNAGFIDQDICAGVGAPCGNNGYLPKFSGLIRTVDINNDGVSELLLPEADSAIAEYCVDFVDANDPDLDLTLCSNSGTANQTLYTEGMSSIDRGIYQMGAYEFVLGSNGQYSLTKVNLNRDLYLGANSGTNIMDAYGDGLTDLLVNVQEAFIYNMDWYITLDNLPSIVALQGLGLFLEHDLGATTGSNGFQGTRYDDYVHRRPGQPGVVGLLAVVI